MTKKDYIIIAHTIAILKNNYHITEKAHEQIIEEFIYQLRRTNPLFSQDKFKKACGVEEA